MKTNVKVQIDLLLAQVNSCDFEAYAAEVLAKAQIAVDSIRTAGQRAKAWAAKCPPIPPGLNLEFDGRSSDGDVLWPMQKGDYGADLQQWAQERAWALDLPTTDDGGMGLDESIKQPETVFRIAAHPTYWLSLYIKPGTTATATK